MDKPKVYVETTFVSYLTAWPSRDVVMHGHQQISREWWANRRDRFELCTSELVIQEASAGDTEAARERLEVLTTLPIIRSNPEAVELTKRILEAGAVPPKAAADAAHIALAAVYGIDFLLTWNCKHLANLVTRALIEDVCRAVGYKAPAIGTPEMLLED